MGKNIALSALIAFFGCKGISQEEKDKKTSKKDTEIAYAVQKTDAEWRAQLTDMEYYVLRKAATENPFSSELLANKEQGTYVCAGCGTGLFRSEHKFNSGTGWPSFDRGIDGNVAYDVDYKIGYPRTEEHCATCGGHLGHVFDDGPANTTGKRHCINGAALNFIADVEE
ncbi:MAG: peptide-methionine (R)-S-oxide reductase MsrB [Flavobacteriaceae bacterium]|nr:peptide-methionine (R)-S-oxide reductase MsrB [Flavobacteriaceae bacterium]